jgi:hypothetical protein
VSNLPAYGITNSSGSAVVQFDSAVEFDVDADSAINSHPIEQGQFAAYNRVQEPIKIGLLLACQGKTASSASGAQSIRTSFISTLKALRQGTQVVTISTPDASYPNMTLKRFSYKKTADRGAVTIWADTQWAEEQSSNVAVSAPATSQPQGNAVINFGALQAAEVNAQQAAAIANPPIAPALLPSGYFSTMPSSGDAF